MHNVCKYGNTNCLAYHKTIFEHKYCLRSHKKNVVYFQLYTLVRLDAFFDIRLLRNECM